MSTQPPPAALPSRMDAPVRPDDIRTGLALILGRAPRALGEIQDYLRFPTVAALGEALLRHPDLPARLAALGVMKDAQEAPALRRAPDAIAVRDAYELLLRRAPERPTAEAMHAVGRRFPPNHLHHSWMDFLYWDAELES